MQIKIDGKEYELNFGVRWVLLMNKKYHAADAGLDQGMGITQAVSSLTQYEPEGLAEILLTATWINKSRPTLEDIYHYLETNADIAKLCDAIMKEIKEANATKAAVKNVLEAVKKRQRALLKNSEKLD
ncbi:tail assembly chaperone [Lactobacillus gasseri]|jgi:hypothetical protein|uniref:tail assembly chaperone n=1 Tax=Lactobacillus gasseri TaxID=1596 RepID=UPI00389BF3EE